MQSAAVATVKGAHTRWLCFQKLGSCFFGADLTQVFKWKMRMLLLTNSISFC